ncbi:MAG: MFS transporter [bacterium]|jgi:SHS family sialic acid transporter-like MFS transporter
MNEQSAGNVQVVEDIYAKSSFYRWLALIAALLAWTFDGVEQGVYGIMTRPALLELVPGISEYVDQQVELNQQIEQRMAEQLSVEELKVKAQDLKEKIDGPIGKIFSWALASWLWGAACGGVIFGRMGDRYGRVRSLIFAVIIYSGFTGLSALTTHWSQFLACRFLGAIGLGGAWPLSVALMVETWPDKYRAVLAGLMGMGANIGFFIAATYSEIMGGMGFDWRWIIGMGFFIGISSLLLIVFVPEPTKWRLARAKKQHSSLGDLFAPKYRRATIVGSLLSTIALLGTWGAFLWLPTYVDQIAQGTEFQDTARSTVARWQAYGQMFGGFMGGVLAGVMGNKKSWAFLCVTAWASVMALFWFNDVFGYQVLWMGALAGLFVTAFFGWLPKYLPELYPTRIRATGQGFSFNIGRILAGFGVLGTGTLVALFGGNYQRSTMVICTIYLIGLIVILFAPDTGGHMVSDEEDAASMNAAPRVE